MDTVIGEFHAWDKQFQAYMRDTIQRFKEEYYEKWIATQKGSKKTSKPKTSKSKNGKTVVN